MCYPIKWENIGSHPFWPQRHFDPTDILTPKTLWPQETLTLRTFWPQRHFDPKDTLTLSQKKTFWPQRHFDPKTLWPQTLWPQPLKRQFDPTDILTPDILTQDTLTQDLISHSPFFMLYEKFHYSGIPSIRIQLQTYVDLFWNKQDYSKKCILVWIRCGKLY